MGKRSDRLARAARKRKRKRSELWQRVNKRREMYAAKHRRRQREAAEAEADRMAPAARLGGCRSVGWGSGRAFASYPGARGRFSRSLTGFPASATG